jgi:HK97 gp10 family phage protein
MGVEAKVTNLPDFKRQLLALPEKLRKRALRNALAAGARAVRDAARVKAPVLQFPTKTRKPGTVRDAISVRSSKRDRLEGNVGVFVNVRPAAGAKFKTVKGSALFGLVKTKSRVQTKASKRGANSRDDPFYWRWLEFGWNPASRDTGGRGKAGKSQRRKLNKSTDAKIRSGFRFLQAGANRLNEALRIFTEKLRPAIDKLNKGQTP